MSAYCELGEMAEVYVATTHRARKQHTCDECSHEIEPGEQYERAFMIYDGHLDVFRTCCRCQPMADWVVRNCGCRMHADLWRHLREDVWGEMAGELNPGVHFKVGRWLVEARRRGVRA